MKVPFAASALNPALARLVRLSAERVGGSAKAGRAWRSARRRATRYGGICFLLATFQGAPVLAEPAAAGSPNAAPSAPAAAGPAPSAPAVAAAPGTLAATGSGSAAPAAVAAASGTLAATGSGSAAPAAVAAASAAPTAAGSGTAAPAAVALAPSAPAAAGSGSAAPASDSTSLGLRADCLHHFNYNKGSSQDCLTISGLRFDATHTLSPETRATLRLDPFATPVAAKAATPLRAGLPIVRDTAFVIIDDYALIWSPRPNLDLAVQSFGGTATIPSVSGLSLANPFSDTGWKQSALTVTYHLTALPDMAVKFAAGNGEGENGANLDAQQYFGFQIEATVLRGLRVNFGASFDGNNAGSQEASWEDQRLQKTCGVAVPTDRAKLGYSTQRLAAGATYAGAVEGLTLGFGWQRNVLSDLDKAHTWAVPPTALDKCGPLDPVTLFVEDPKLKAVNTVQRTTYDVSARYRLFTRYFAGADISTRRLDTGSVDVFTTGGGRSTNTLAQSSYAGGLGVDLGPGLTLVLEYASQAFDSKYTQFYYLGKEGKSVTTEELFNARIAYDWR